MTRVFLGLGSNIDPEANIRLGLKAIERRIARPEVSPVYRAPALGFAGADFLNLVVGVDTTLSPEALIAVIEAIHALAGRERDGTSKWVARTLDIDLLTYGDLVAPDPPLRVPRGDILDYAFVLRPLAELAPDAVHPLTGRRFAAHWADFAAAALPLVPVDWKQIDCNFSAASPVEPR